MACSLVFKSLKEWLIAVRRVQVPLLEGESALKDASVGKDLTLVQKVYKPNLGKNKAAVFLQSSL